MWEFFLPDHPMKERSLIRPSVPFVSSAAVAAMCLFMASASAQTNIPPAPRPAPSAAPAQTPAAPAAQAPEAPTPAPTQVPAAPEATPSAPIPAPTAPAFPKTYATNFTATSPTKEEVDAFLHANWGYDPDRVWQVQAIVKTPVDGVSKVIVLVGDKTGKGKIGGLAFFTLPDGKHIISGDNLMAFGPNPFAVARAELEQRADGPSRGSASKNLEVVEFADFQAPEGKTAEANLDKLAADFPEAHIVFQNNPIAAAHPEAVKAAEYGACVNELGGSSAFFKFAAAVFSGQAGLATADGATMTLNSAVNEAGLDPSKVTACAATPATQAAVASSIKLGEDVGIQTAPTLMINGRGVPANAPYDLIKKIVEFQAKLDGVPLTQPQ
jgi:protein-disulfide isomerase